MYKMNKEIEKSKQPNPEDILRAITSFNDPSILTGIFQELGWDYSFEIREWLAMARQNANLSVKAKALIQLRKLLHEAAETAGYVANVSQTIPNAQGGHTTFSGKQMAGMLNPVKKIESTIKETQNGKQKETGTESDRESNRPESHNVSEGSGESQGRSSDGTDTADQFPPDQDTGRADADRDVDSGGIEPEHGGETSGRQRPGPAESPCIDTKPPTCDPKLFPGISTSTE